MKSRLFLVGMLALVVSLPITAEAASPPAKAEAGKAPAGEAATIGVDTLVKKPESYTGTVRVRGVVSSVFPKEQRLGLIDEVYLNCCSSPCSSIQTLPVKWTGDIPPVKILVVVTGEIQRAKGKLEFVAKGIDRIEAGAETGR